jgi:DNA-binding MarR family transcriptional regulator
MAPDAEFTDGVDERVRTTVAAWPQVDPVVEAIINRINRVDRLIEKAAQTNLAQVGLNHQELKVMFRLHGGPRSHGWLSRDLMTSTGAMTNRLDKLEQAGFVRRERDPNDRRGVLLVLTDAGRAKLDEYAELAGGHERELLGALTAAERKELNRVLAKLSGSLQRELGPPPFDWPKPDA